MAATLNWELAAAQLLEMEPRPSALLSAEGVVLLANHAFRTLLEEGAPLEQARFAEEIARPASAAGFLSALRALRPGSVARALVGLRRARWACTLALELKVLGQGASQVVLLVVVDVKPDRVEVPLEPVNGVIYEVELDGAGSSGRVLGVVGQSARHDDSPCWERVFGRSEPCDPCPVRTMSERGQTTVVLPATANRFAATLLTAERRADGSARVSGTNINEQSLSQLVDARVAHLSRLAGLTGREQEVLSLLLLGRSLAEVARAAGITARTAKYHQQNLLKKLGADSRNDLLRLLL